MSGQQRNKPKMPAINFDLYYAVEVADQAFSASLVAAYGPARAAEMRYAFGYPGHPEVEAAAKTFMAASDAWLEEMRHIQKPTERAA